MNGTSPPAPSLLARARLALLGGASAALQTLFAREYLAACGGNEISVAAVFGAWLAATAVGAFAARRLPRPRLALALFGLLGFAAVLAARLLPRLFAAGAVPGTAATFAWALVLLSPGCIASGVAFGALAAPVRSGARAYRADSLGAAAAGAALSLWLLGRVPAFALAGAVVGACLAAAAAGEFLVPLPASGRRWRGVVAAVTVMLAAGAVLAGAAAGHLAGRWALRVRIDLPGEIEEVDTAQGQTVVRSDGPQTDLFVDRALVASSAQPETAEEAAHLALGLHPAPRALAIVGVPPGGAVRAALAHGLERVDLFVEEAALAALLRGRFPDLQDARVTLVTGDARRALAARPASYDAVLLAVPEPLNAGLNRFYSSEFFAAARASLRSGGLFALSASGHDAWSGVERRRVYGSIRATLESAFGSVAILPAGRTFFLASREGPVPRAEEAAARIGAALVARGIAAEYLRPARLADLLSPQRVADARRWAGLDEPVNRDLRPSTYRLALDKALADLGDGGEQALLALAALIAVAALFAFSPRARPVAWAVFTTGAAGMGMQLGLLLALQIATGALYRELGLLLAGFMLGAALGTALPRSPARARFWIVAADAAQLATAVAIAFALPALAGAGTGGGVVAARFALFGAAALAGLAPGAQFAAAPFDYGLSAASAQGERTAALYGADLLGAALGALVVLTVLVPLTGLAGAFFAFAGLKVTSLCALAFGGFASPFDYGRIAASAQGERSAGPGRWAPLLFPAALLALAAAAAADAPQRALDAITAAPAWQIAVVAMLLLLGLVSAFLPAARAGGRTRFGEGGRGRGLERIASFAALLPLGALPLGRCWFQIPYLFCHVCPRQCAFGVLRPYVVPVALIANLHDHRFCERLCPLGAAQAGCERAGRGERPRRVPALTGLRLASLALTAGAWFLARIDPALGAGGTGLAASLYKNGFTPSAWMLGAAIALLLLSFRVRRPFCSGLCPIGGASALLARLERRIAPADRGSAATAAAPPLPATTTTSSSTSSSADPEVPR